MSSWLAGCVLIDVLLVAICLKHSWLRFARYALGCLLPETCAKGTKREVSGMPIPGSLITVDLREASYYQEYLANVVKHRWFLADEPARMPNPTAQKVWINILQYLIHMRMCKDVPTKMMKMFLLVENLRQQNPDNREVLHPG
nr:hypothetical protein [Tanacetum cinerariifolium]